MRRTVLIVGVSIVFLGCAGGVYVLGSFLRNPFGFDRHLEFVEISGKAAQRRLKAEGEWPVPVDAANVQTVSYRGEASRDSYSHWFRIQLTPAAARAWADHVHARQELTSTQYADFVEGVHHTVTGPPPLHEQTGETPEWWTPPVLEFRATEVMLASVARATYSRFDDRTRTLWIYDYACQHDELWYPGSIPEGEQFGSPPP